MSDYFFTHKKSLDYSMAMILKMREFSSPLFENTKINNFSYLRFNENGTVVNLTTEEKWIQFRFEKKIKYKILFDDQLDNAKINIPSIYLWPQNTEDVLLNALYNFDIWNGCNIYTKNSSYIDVFSFASSKEAENMQNFYINNLDLLKSFIIYFKQQINEDFYQINARENLIQTDLKFPNKSCYQNHHKAFFDLIRLKRINITKDIYFTYKELECCIYLMRGNKIKAIAQKSKLSPRTVETHLNNAKLRANCSTKEKLIDLINENYWIVDAFSHY